MKGDGLENEWMRDLVNDEQGLTQAQLNDLSNRLEEGGGKDFCLQAVLAESPSEAKLFKFLQVLDQAVRLKPGVVKLFLGSNQIYACFAPIIKMISGFTELVELDLWGCNSTLNIGTLANCCPRLECLELAQNRLGLRAAEYSQYDDLETSPLYNLLDLARFNWLKTLGLATNDLALGNGFAYLAEALASLMYLKRLNLKNNHISAKSLKLMIPKFAKMHSLSPGSLVLTVDQPVVAKLADQVSSTNQALAKQLANYYGSIICLLTKSENGFKWINAYLSNSLAQKKHPEDSADKSIAAIKNKIKLASLRLNNSSHNWVMDEKTAYVTKRKRELGDAMDIRAVKKPALSSQALASGGRSIHDAVALDVRLQIIAYAPLPPLAGIEMSAKSQR